MAIAAPEPTVELLCDTHTSAGDIMGDGVDEREVDALDFRTRFRVIEINVLGVDQRLFLCAVGLPELGDRPRIRRMSVRVCWLPGFSRKRA